MAPTFCCRPVGPPKGRLKFVLELGLGVAEIGGVAPYSLTAKRAVLIGHAKQNSRRPVGSAGSCGKDGARPAIAGCRSKDPYLIETPATGFQQVDFLGSALALHTANGALNIGAYGPISTRRRTGSARRQGWGADRWKIPSRYAARSARAVFATAPAEFKPAIRGNVRIAKSSSFSRKGRSIATSSLRFEMPNGCAGRSARRMKSGHRRRGSTSIGGKAANAPMRVYRRSRCGLSFSLASSRGTILAVLPA
jgi:hypothetical protein